MNPDQDNVNQPPLQQPGTLPPIESYPPPDMNAGRRNTKKKLIVVIVVLLTLLSLVGAYAAYAIFSSQGTRTLSDVIADVKGKNYYLTLENTESAEMYVNIGGSLVTTSEVVVNQDDCQVTIDSNSPAHLLLFTGTSNFELRKINNETYVHYPDGNTSGERGWLENNRAEYEEMCSDLFVFDLVALQKFSDRFKQTGSDSSYSVALTRAELGEVVGAKFGLDQVSGETFEMHMNFAADQDMFQLEMTTVVADTGDTSEEFKTNIELILKDYGKAPVVEKPELGASAPIQNQSSDRTQSSSPDTERMTDIKALHGQLEAYYAQNGSYPTLANVNDAAFRTANMKGVDVEALTDPNGSTPVLVVAPTANAYAYTVLPADCENSVQNKCITYTLTATLQDGSTYERKSL